MFNFKLWSIGLLSGALALVGGAQTLGERTEVEAQGPGLEELGRVEGKPKGTLLDILGRGELTSPGRLEEAVQIEESVEDELSVPRPLEEDAAREEMEGVPSLPEGEGGVNTAMVLPNVQAGDGPGTLEGVVFDADGKGIPGVIVVFPELGGFKVRGGPEGGFRVTGLPATGVAVLLMKPAYVSKDEVVEVQAEGVTRARMSMELRPIELAEGEYNLDSREVLLEYEEDEFGGIALGGEQGLNFVSGIGKEEFSKQNVSNAADAIGKVAGANVVGGRYAVIRGLADRYVSTTVNGALISTADPSKKAVQLDLFPTSALEGINVFKTYSPNLPGDFGGGTIDIRFLRFPSEPLFEVGYKLTTNSNLDRNFYTHPDRDLGFLGDVNDPIPRDLFFVDPEAARPVFHQGSQNAPNPAAAAAWQELFGRQGLLPKMADTKPAQSYGLTLGDTFEFGNGNKLGFVLSGQRKEEDEINHGIKRSQVVPFRQWTQDDYSRSVDWGLLASAGLQLGENHTIGASYFKKRIASDKITHGREILFPEDGWTWGSIISDADFIKQYGAAAYQSGDFWRIDPVIRELELFQVDGSHQMGERGLKIGWGLTHSESGESRPQSSTFNRSVLDFADPALLESVAEANRRLDSEFAKPFANLLIGRPDLFGDIIPNIGDPDTITWAELRTAIGGNSRAELLAGNRESQAGLVPLDASLGEIPLVSNADVNPANSQMFTSILSQEIREQTDEQRVNFDLPFYFSEESDDRFVLSGGWRSLAKRRTSRGILANLQFNLLNQTDTDRQGPDYDPSLSEELAANPDLISEYLSGQRQGHPFFSNGLAFESRNYDGSSDLEAFYVMGMLAWDSWTLSGGARFEEEERSYFLLPRPFNALPPDQQDTGVGGSVIEDAILPSLSLGRSWADDSISVDLSWSQTVARPTFFEFLPAFTLDQATQSKRLGNFFLTQSDITNKDISVEWAPNEDDLLRLSYFHKLIESPIVEIYQESVGTTGFDNGEEGILSGVELEFAKNLSEHWSLSGNYTYINAVLEYYVARSGIDDRQLVTVRFPYQPEHILNLNLGFDHEDSGWGLNLIYNYTGGYPTLLRNATDGTDILQNEQHGLDMVIRKTIQLEGDNEFTITAGVENVLATMRTRTYSSGPLAGETADEDRPGRSFFVGGKVSF
ncbi:MAG: outer membrane beta-barrel protein [Verrucomicrobia bacterium]|nr:outer membrane beta-barrel protein [Verrucomicrobiota bacterium]MDA1005652.1 outer membrane beta-barrel protein [Verrucomicrobiota bacterium]